jgi:hypothetical protein
MQRMHPVFQSPLAKQLIAILEPAFVVVIATWGQALVR